MVDSYDAIESKVESIIEPLVLGKGFELADTEFLQEGGYWYLRIYLDKDDGVSLEDCEMVSRMVEDIVDGIIDKKFFLEVSSPGLERRLKKEKDFIKFIGKKATVRLKSKLNDVKYDSKSFEGIIEKYENENLYLKVENEIVEIPNKKIEKAKLVFDFEEFSRREEHEE